MKIPHPTPRTKVLLSCFGLILALFSIVPGTVLVADTRATTRATEVMDKGAEPPTLPDGLSAPEWHSMQELVAAAEYQFTWQMSDGIPAYRAPNRAHDLSLSLTAEGLHAARYGPDGEPLWDWGLSLVAYGSQTFAAVDRAGLRGLRERVEVHRSRDVVEWYANGTDGVEHGLTLAAPPAGTDGSTVELTFALHGSLTPKLDGSGQVLRLKDGGKTVLVYDQLAVYDATGRALPAHMCLSGGVQSAELQLVVDAAGATYPLTVDPLLHSQAGRLRASDAEDNDYYGSSVDVSGDTAVVGAYSEDGAGSDRGAAYVLARNEGRGTSWGEVIKLTASDAADEDRFGFSVAISGDAGTIVVGAYTEDTAGAILGAAYVFARNKGGADNWGQVRKLTVTGTDSYANFGVSVDIDENAGAIAIGAYRLDGGGSWRGAAYVFARNKGGVDNWGMVKTLTAGTDAEDAAWFGYSVAISHDTVVVGAYGEEGAGIDRGAAYVFKRDKGGTDNWGQVKKLTAGADAGDFDHFGYSVAISGDTIVAGAFSKDGAGSERGAAYVFERNEGGVDHWNQVKKLTASDAVDGDHFGWAVAISIDTVVVGAHEKDGAGSERGAVYVFQRNQGGADNWGQVEELVASDAEDGDSFGISVAISINTILVGANREDGAGTDRGAAYLFRLAGGQWLEVARPTASDAEDDDQFGISVAISGDTAIVGAHWEDGAGTDRGAAYLLERNWNSADSWGQVTKIVCFDCVSEDYFGRSVAISGDTAVVGAWGAGSGAAYVYERNWNMYNPPNPQADSWGEVAKLTAGADSVSGDYFGFSVAISGDTVIVGARGISDYRGAAYVFGRNQGGADNWGQVIRLTASDAADGDYFGFSVAISGDTAIVGAFAEDGAGSNRGAAYIYQRNYDPGTPATPIADNWGQVKKLTASDAEDEDNFGISVAISGDTAIVGAHKKNLGIIMVYDRGAAYVYARNYNPSTPTTPDADNWGEVQRVTASPYAENYAYFGRSVSISGDTAVVGAYAEDGAGSARGAAYVFERNQGGFDNWGQVIRLTASDAADGDYFGFSVAISGDTIIVGAYGKDGTGGSDRGAAYIFPLSEYRVYLPLVLRNY